MHFIKVTCCFILWTKQVTNKERLIKLFFENVYGKMFNDDGSKNRQHDGREGHWLEEQLGIKANGNTAPDILGYELKKETSSKTTFGDWSPDKKIWGKKFEIEPNLSPITRDQFLQIFGKPNEEKGGRYSWSGTPTPKYGYFNSYGQKIIIDPIGNIQAIYSFKEDKRENKHEIVLKQFQIPLNCIIAQWSRDKIEAKLLAKFGQKGWVKAHKDNTGAYSHLTFGAPITYEDWLQNIRDGIVFFDSGMYQGNSRPYSQWRSNNRNWDSNAIDTVTYADYSIRQ